jgi:uncharacterized membrane-anchored protein YhcB (DUF1043 family)
MYLLNWTDYIAVEIFAPIIVGVILFVFLRKFKKENSQQHGEVVVVLEKMDKKLKKIDKKLESHVGDDHQHKHQPELSTD